jgi:hypothetical protein
VERRGLREHGSRPGRVGGRGIGGRGGGLEDHDDIARCHCRGEGEGERQIGTGGGDHVGPAVGDLRGDDGAALDVDDDGEVVDVVAALAEDVGDRVGEETGGFDQVDLHAMLRVGGVGRTGGVGARCPAPWWGGSAATSRGGAVAMSTK